MKKIFTIFFSTVVFVAQHCSAQIITTIAGNGVGAYTGDNGPATAASLGTPFGVAVDNSGNIYIADTYNNVIRKVTSAGTISTIAGNGTDIYSGDGVSATATGFAKPTGVILDENGNILFADDYNHCIRKVNAAGIVSTVAGNGTMGYSGDGGPATAAMLSEPSDIAFDGNGNLYIVDYSSKVIRMVNTSGTISTIAGNGNTGYTGDGGPATAAEFDFPYGIATDGGNNIYVADEINKVIRKINTTGIISTVAGNGISGYSGDGGPTTAAELNDPTGVAVDASGNIYIADLDNNVIRKVNSAGIITTIVGNNTQGYTGDGGTATAAELNEPSELCLDGSGNIFIADTYNNVIRKISNTTGVNVINANNGFTTTVAPNPTTTDVLLSYSGAFEDVSIGLTDITGRVIYNTRSAAGSGNVSIPLASLPKGYYLLTTESGNMKAVNKVVKE